jgi:hypothetical protein
MIAADPKAIQKLDEKMRSGAGWKVCRDECRDNAKNQQKTANSNKVEFAVMIDFSSRNRF